MTIAVDAADVEVGDGSAKTPLLWVLRDLIGNHAVFELGEACP